MCAAFIFRMSGSRGVVLKIFCGSHQDKPRHNACLDIKPAIIYFGLD